MDRRGLIRNLVAALWGFAEATLFFIVPDVLLTFLALGRLRRALVACVYVTAGALVGGAAMYAWAKNDPAGAVAALEAVPAVSAGMIERVRAGLEQRGLVAMIAGAFMGTPYKIYAVQAAPAGIAPAVFLLASIPARLVRFVLASLIAHAVASRVVPGWSPRKKVAVLSGFWVTFYATFLWLMPW